MRKLKLFLIIVFFSGHIVSIYGQIKQGAVIVGGNKVDVGQNGIVTRDGGYAMTGYTTSFGSSNSSIYLVKFDSLFNLKWTKVFDGPTNSAFNLNNLPYSIIQTKDGGYAIAGWTSSYGLISNDGGDVYIIKTDSIGTIEWTKTIGGNNNDGAERILQTSDGGYIVTGWTNSFGTGSYKEWWSYNIYVIRLDSKGAIKWNETITGNSWSI
ncbi:MAG TPA: hypothetical protein VK783_07160, partial [Bacteroidia bacterium]|nr:hypothetical protein [Bacteroidia bacterium]